MSDCGGRYGWFYNDGRIGDSCVYGSGRGMDCEAEAHAGQKLYAAAYGNY